MNKIDEFIEWAKSNSWDIKEKNNCSFNICNEVYNRYKNIPKEYLEFLNKVEQCVSPDDTSWLLCEGEYDGTSDIEFTWNEFENISLGAAEKDNELIDGIYQFWNKNMPILMSVNNRYSFYAINVNNKSVVYGYEPEFEEADVVANSFFDLLDLIMKNKIEL